MKTSEVSFVEWSRRIGPQSEDVRLAAATLPRDRPLRGLDVGGGIGQFASALLSHLAPGSSVLILDPSELAERHAVRQPGLDFQRGDFLEHSDDRRYDFIILKTVLHHLIAPLDRPGERRTREAQALALRKARNLLTEDGVLLVEENLYDGIGGSDVTGRLVFLLTRLRPIAPLTRRLGANTAGEGVRFRSRRSWETLLAEAGLLIRSRHRIGAWGGRWPLWQRAALLAQGRCQEIWVVGRA